MNIWIAAGRLCKDPEITSLTSGKTKAKFSLAVDRKFKTENGPTADFFPCVCFGKLAEFCERYLKKGTKVIVRGEPQNDNYTDKNGNKVYGWNYILNDIEFAESKSSSGDNSSSANSNNDDFLNIEIPVEDLPFS